MRIDIFASRRGLIRREDTLGQSLRKKNPEPAWIKATTTTWDEAWNKIFASQQPILTCLLYGSS